MDKNAGCYAFFRFSVFEVGRICILGKEGTRGLHLLHRGRENINFFDAEIVRAQGVVIVFSF